MMTKEFKFTLLSSMFIAGYIGANLLGSKVAQVGTLAVSVGIFAYPLTFLMTDVIAEVWGKKKSKQVMYAALVAQIFILGLTFIAIALPPAGRYTLNNEYTAVFQGSIRMIVASLIAFLLAQTHDIWAFEFWKKKTKGKMLWLRNNLSTMVSQGIDTIVFMFIAFYGINDKFTAAFIMQLVFTYWLFKVVIAAIDTPFVYALVKWAKK